MKKKEIKFIYNSKKPRDKEAFGLVSSLENYVVNEHDIAKNKMTQTQLAQLADDLKMSVFDLLEQSHEGFDIKYNTYDRSDLLQIIHENMTMLKTPIIYIDGTCKIIKTPFDLHATDLEIEGIELNK